MNESWTVILEQDENGEIVLPLGEAFMQKHGWVMGDQISWELGNGCAIMTNVSARERENERNKSN